MQQTCPSVTGNYMNCLTYNVQCLLISSLVLECISLHRLCHCLHHGRITEGVFMLFFLFVLSLDDGTSFSTVLCREIVPNSAQNVRYVTLTRKGYVSVYCFSPLQSWVVIRTDQPQTPIVVECYPMWFQYSLRESVLELRFYNIVLASCSYDCALFPWIPTEVRIQRPTSQRVRSSCLTWRTKRPHASQM